MSGYDQLFVPGMTTSAGCVTPSSELSRAAKVLKWPGITIDEMQLFSQRVAVVAEVDSHAHDERVASGWGPVTDRMAVALWEWEESRATMPPAVVTLRGVIARGQRWQRVLAAAGGFVGFCSTAILLDQSHEPNQHCLMTAHMHGIAVLRSSQPGECPHLAQVGRVGPVATARPSTLSRWVEELVYARLLDDDLLTAQVTG
ncbi:hypothetical protein [Amycolatopsis sp. MJM2582]|uniref:hypothetical protein n=1 Tax=Amycolatopsis sp. MJM2582 TaxID=1427749 RepID=UPI00068D398A|nr:hypothetical protein [Amycolatopsis sp. MJM2582]